MYDDDLDEFIAALQDVVLPAGVPVVPGLDVAGHFSVPADPGESTGAWFDVIVLRSGRVGLALGQVPGSGLAAVAAAGGISAVLRAGLLCHEDPVAALQLGDLHAAHAADVQGTTAVLALLDLRAGELTYATAGHDAPVLAATDGPSRRLARTAGGPLGASGDITVGHQRLESGDLVLLSTPTSTDTTTALLDRTRVAGDASSSCAAFAENAAADQLRGAVIVVVAELADDVPADLDVELPIDDTTTRRTRRQLEEWLTTVGATSMDALSLTHATAELVSNAVEHAYAGSDGRQGTVHLRAVHGTDGHVVVDVSDHGQWRNATDDIARGRGLAMAAGLVDELAVTTGAEGTSARLHHRLSRPVPIDRVPIRASWPEAEPLEVTQTELGSVRLSGEFGHDEVDEITYALLLASRGRTQTVDLDLTDVTAISAGGLRVLGDLVRVPSEGSDDRASVVLHAREGSPAQAELERAGIAHRAS
ncbi:ATP-binding protein [Nocardioides sp.]|uniref:ATP-binding protein n=1 Tax=Nocardioides sp. TaxID=35761 RepID=UPI002723E793|nr:ATP-binding protein [Nocardioides sp.]MDO9457682.1 SpoIIE family protein phosphatase [Nocardioides sp.]